MNETGGGLRDLIQIKGPHIANFVFAHPLVGMAMEVLHVLWRNTKIEVMNSKYYLPLFRRPFMTDHDDS
jgi:hypothetical protein